MPYAHYDLVRNGTIAGGVDISDAEYAAAIAGMMNAADPKQVSISGGTYSLVTPAYPVEFSLSLDTATTLPVISGSRTPVNTGLCRHPSGTGWLVGDADSTASPPRDAGVIHYNDSWVQQGRFQWNDYGFAGSDFACQGVDANPADGTFWAAINTIDTVVQINASTGTLVNEFALGHTPSGLALIPERNEFITLTSSGEIRRLSMDDATLLSGPFSVPGAPATSDQLSYIGGGKMLLTYDDSPSDGVLLLLDVSNDRPITERKITLGSADFVEGVCLHADRLYICNDGEFHGGDPALNRVLEYGVTGLFR